MNLIGEDAVARFRRLGCHSCFSLEFYGFQSWTFTIVTLWIVGVASGSTISLTPYFKVLVLHILLLFAPVFGRTIFIGGA
jgi:hypothetical protein